VENLPFAICYFILKDQMQLLFNSFNKTVKDFYLNNIGHNISKITLYKMTPTTIPIIKRILFLFL
jgi:hypothetical protein